MNRAIESRWTALAFAMLAAGCTDPVPQAPTPEPPQKYLGASVQNIPENVIAAAVLVSAEAYDSAYIAYQSGPGGPVSRTPAIGFAGGDEVRIPVLGLDTASAYTFRVVLALIGAADTTVDSLAFTSGSLPDWITAIGTLGATPQSGYLTLSRPEGVVTIDNAGKVVWYHSHPNTALNSFQAHPNGSYTIFGAGSGETAFRLLNSLGEELGTLGCVNRVTYFHDLVITSGGDAWLFCADTRVMDLSALGGEPNASVTATVVQQISPSGALLWEWNAFDYFDITDIAPGDRLGLNVDFTHANGIEFDSDSNLILSFRTGNEVTKVNRSTGEVMWRLGGLRNQFTILNDPLGGFDRQHGVRWAGPGQIQMLDNRRTPPSRFVRYLLDTNAMTATMQWEFIDDPTTFTNTGGSTQYHPDGHGTVSFGRAGRVVEVDEAGSKAWELTGLDNVYLFRVQRVGSLYTAGRGDPTR